MAASEESAIQKKLKPEEQEAQPAVTAIADRTEEEDKAEDFISAAAAAAAAATSAHHAAVAGAGAGGVAEEMENGGGSGGAGGQQAAAAVAPAPGPEVVRSPLAAAVARLENHVLERVVKVLLKKCYPPQDGFPMTGKYPPPPPWWPNGRERWWHELGEGVEAPPYKPARLLSKEQKVVAVVAMVKNIAPDYERLAMAMQMASSVTSIITDAEAMAWDAGVTRERDAYIARHPRSAPPTRAWSLMRTLKPEAVRMKRRQPRPPVRINAQDARNLRARSTATAPAPPPAAPAPAPAPVAAPAVPAPAAAVHSAPGHGLATASAAFRTTVPVPFLPAVHFAPGHGLATASVTIHATIPVAVPAAVAATATAPATSTAVPATATATAADSAAMEAAIAMIEAMKNKLKDPNAPYFPMPYPLLPPGTFEIIHDTEVDPHDDPENPIIWKEYTRIQGNLVLKRAGRKKGGVEIYDSVKEEGEGSSSGGPRRGRLVMETNAQAQAYYRSLRNNGAPAGGAAGAGRTDKGKETAEAGGSGIYQNAGAGVKTEHEDEHSEASNKGSGAILQPNKDGNQELTNDPENWGGLTIQESALEHHTELTNDPENWGGLTTQENSLEHHSTALYSVMSNGSKIGDDNTNNEVGTETGTFPMLAGDDDNISALDRWFENKYLAEHSNDIPDILDESNADKVNTW